MNIEIAIMYVERAKKGYSDKHFHKAFDAAVEALGKQIPTKPELNHHCPNCNRALPIPGLVDEWCKECFYPSFCPCCGQLIDWGDEE